MKPDVQKIVKNLRESDHVWRTRFAPSPTGYLHLGHIAAASYLWTIAKKIDAAVILRIEDHDLGRSRDEYIEAILSDLEWLGFKADLAPSRSDWKTSELLQSNREKYYEDAFSDLKSKNLIYKCDCSRKKIIERTGVQHPELVYDGHCFSRQKEITENYGWRFKVPDRNVTFVDLVHGVSTQYPLEQCGDFLIKDRDGQWTYQFSSVVDDLQQGVNLIIRGVDIMPSTGRQILLARSLEALNVPKYAHHPLILNESGEKLSKRSYDYSIHQARVDGLTPEELFGEIAMQIGVAEQPSHFSREEFLDLLRAAQ